MSLRIIFVSFFLYYFVLNDSNYSCNLIDKSRILEYQLLNIIQTNEAGVYIHNLHTLSSLKSTHFSFVPFLLNTKS